MTRSASYYDDEPYQRRQSTKLEDLPLLMPPSVAVDTSEAAADKIKASARAMRALIYRYLKEQGTSGATCQEVCQHFGWDGNTVRPRLWELEGAFGEIEKSEATRPTNSGRQAHVYVVKLNQGA